MARILAAGKPYVFYIHPWEIDPEQPRISGLRKSLAFRHYHNLAKCDARFASLLRDFAWMPIGALLDKSRTDAITLNTD